MIGRVFHVVSRRKLTDQKTIQRCSRAFESWEWMYAIGDVVPVHCWETKRDARSIGDTRDLPFLKDIVEQGIKRSSNQYDIIMLTNDDVIVHPMLLGEIRRHVALYECGVIRRLDIPQNKSRRMPSLDQPPIAFIEMGLPHIGRDAAVFTKRWYERFSDLIPDFLLGAPYWDMCIAALMRLLQGIRQDNLSNFYDTVDSCDLPDGLLIHESHDAFWRDKENNPSNQHNRKLFDSFCKTHWPEMSLSKQVGPLTWPMNVLIRYSKIGNDSGKLHYEDLVKAIKR